MFRFAGCYRCNCLLYPSEPVQQLPWEKWCKLIVSPRFRNRTWERERESDDNLVERCWGRFYDYSMKWLFSAVSFCCCFFSPSRWNMNVECRYLFYNSLNKRTQSSLCLFIQFSLRSIISNFFLSSLSFFLFSFLVSPSLSTSSFHHNKAQWLRTIESHFLLVFRSDESIKKLRRWIRNRRKRRKEKKSHWWLMKNSFIPLKSV